MCSVARLSLLTETLSKLADLISWGNELAKAKHASEEKTLTFAIRAHLCVVALFVKKRKKSHGDLHFHQRTVVRLKVIVVHGNKVNSSLVTK